MTDKKSLGTNTGAQPFPTKDRRRKELIFYTNRSKYAQALMYIFLSLFVMIVFYRSYLYLFILPDPTTGEILKHILLGSFLIGICGFVLLSYLYMPAFKIDNALLKEWTGFMFKEYKISDIQEPVTFKTILRIPFIKVFYKEKTTWINIMTLTQRDRVALLEAINERVNY